jgi:hypothetical protein
MEMHMVWSQGWGKAPPRAMRNRDAWASLGVINCWSVESAIKHQLPGCDLLQTYAVGSRLAKAPAAQADLILQGACMKHGGIMLGADNEPNGHHGEELIWSAEHAEKFDVAQIVMQTLRPGEPFQECAYWPQSSEVLGVIMDRVRENLLSADPDDFKKVYAMTGARNWRHVRDNNRAFWDTNVFEVPGYVAYKFEPKTRNKRELWNEKAWVDPGLTFDWFGEKKEVWL